MRAARERRRCSWSALTRSAVWSSTSTNWHPASAALARICNWEAMEPRNLPPLVARRQVAMATTWGWNSVNCLILGSASPGLGFLDHFIGILTDDGYADPGQTQRDPGGLEAGNVVLSGQCHGSSRRDITGP